MDQLRKILSEWLSKYKFVLIIVAIGIVMMLLPGRNATGESEKLNETVPIQTETLECRLEQILTSISGAGEVDVLLTIDRGEEVFYQINEDVQTDESNESRRTDTVTVTDMQRNENGLVQQVNPPRYLGAVIVCQGAEDHTVRLAIVDAVAKATGLGANKISVLKMK